MSYRDILVLRKEARGWRLEDIGDDPPEDPPLDPELMEGLQDGDPQVGDLLVATVSLAGCEFAVLAEISSTETISVSGRLSLYYILQLFEACVDVLLSYPVL